MLENGWHLPSDSRPSANAAPAIAAGLGLAAFGLGGLVLGGFGLGGLVSRGLAGLFLRPDRRPDLPLLQKRFELLMTWTLPEIHCDDMHLSGLHKQGKEWLATYRFVVYATQGSEASPVIRARLKRRFPECGELLFQTGKACTVEERVRFVPVQQHGLVPEKVVLDYPELLSQM